MYMPRVVAAPLTRLGRLGRFGRLGRLGRARGTVWNQLLSFAVVGGVGFLLDVGVFNLLSLTVLSAHVVAAGPLYAKAISTLLAIAANWMGNRWLTFRQSRRADVAREAIEFAVVSLAGGAIALACLWFSHYVLGLHTTLADNISANVVGLLLGSAFRFVAYRSWVFSARRARVQEWPEKRAV